MGRKICRFGTLTTRRRREEAEARAKDPLERKNTGIRSAVRYGFMTKEEALATPNLPHHLIAWIKGYEIKKNKQEK